MSDQRTIAAGAWSNGNGPQPSYATIQQLLADLDVQLQAAGHDAGMLFAPVDVVGAESWQLSRHGARAIYSELRIEIAPGQPRESLRAWFQWMHVTFGWSKRRAPVGVVLDGEGVA